MRSSWPFRRAARLAGASVAGHLVPGHRAALATAPPLLVAGIGSGFVILSNQALTLAEVPPVAGGSAAGVPQAGQRIGSAVGIAAGGSVFFSTLTATHGDYARAFQDGLVIIIALWDIHVSGPTSVTERHRSWS